MRSTQSTVSTISHEVINTVFEIWHNTCHRKVLNAVVEMQSVRSNCNVREMRQETIAPQAGVNQIPHD